MKKFLFKTSLFFIILAIIDQAAGMVFSYCGKHAKGGYVGHHNYIANTAKEDILIFGSSRAIHHYNPSILSDYLNMSCYNCGQDGNGIILFYGLWQMIRERYAPKMIVYDVTLGFDLNAEVSNQKYLGWLRADYDRPGIKDIFILIDANERYKMLSQMYRYNSKFLQNITDYYHPVFGIGGNGFLPLKGELDTLRIRKGKMEDCKSFKLDELKLFFLKKLVDETKAADVRLVFAVSPSWYGANEEQLKPIAKLCREKCVELIDFSNDKKYTHQSKYFKDGNHLNARGADEYTRDILPMLEQP